MPWWMPTPVATFALPYFLPVGRIRGSMRKRARAILGEDLICPGRWPKPDEEEKMKQSLIEQMRMLDRKFKSDAQEWICATPSPSAADFSLQGVLGRLVTDLGDAQMGIATPWLWEESFGAGANSRLQRWSERINAKFPIVFLGKNT